MAKESGCGTLEKWLSKHLMMKLSDVISQNEIDLKLHQVISVQQQRKKCMGLWEKRFRVGEFITN